MAYAFTKLNDYQTWDVFDYTDSGINTNEAIDGVETEFNVTPNPIGTISAGDVIFMSGNNNPGANGVTEIMDVVSVTSTALTVVRGTRGSRINSFTSARDIYLVNDPYSEPMLLGDHLSNQTRAGEGVLISVTRKTFGLSNITNVQILVISGSFLAGDNVDTSSGGDFTLNGTKTTATKDTIVVEGSAETDSTANTNEALDDNEEDITVTSSATSQVWDYIKIEAEYMLIRAITNATTIKVKRGRLGSTAVSHATAQDIYIVDKNGLKQLGDEMITQGWGTVGYTGANINIDGADIMIGLTDQSARTVFLSNLESIDLNGNTIYQVNEATYDTWFEIGVGSIGAKEDNYKGFTGNGSIIKDANISLLSGSLHTYGSLFKESYVSTSSIWNSKRCIFQGNRGNGGLLQGTEPITLVNNLLSGVNIIPGTDTIVSVNNTVENSGTIAFFVITGADSIVNDILGIDIDTGCGAFASSGEKRWIDCIMPWSGINPLSSASFTWYYTLAKTITDIEGNLLENVKASLYQKSDGNLEFDVLSDVDGRFSEIVYRAFIVGGGSGTATDRGPFRLKLQLEGFNDIIQDFDFDDKKPSDCPVIMLRSPYAGAMAQADESV